MTHVLRYIDYWHFLKFPSHILLLVHSVVIASLACSIFSFRKTAYVIWEKIDNHSPFNNNASKNMLIAIFFLFILSFFIVIYYNSNLFIKDTALWALLFLSPTNYEALREESLKLLDSQYLKYVYTFYQNMITPITLLSIISYIIMAKKTITIRLIISLSLLFVFAVLTSNFNVVKSFLFNYSMLIIFFTLWKNNLSARVYYIFFPFFLFISISSICFFIFHEFNLYVNILNAFNRIFIIPLKVGIWYIHYTQLYGMLGVKEFPKISYLLSIESINSPNFIGRFYAPYYYNHSVLESINANSSFLFSFYRAFGLFSCLISTLLILALDLILIIVKRLSKAWIVIALSMLAFKSLAFIASSYTTQLFSGGFVISIFLIYFLDQFLPIMYSFLLQIWQKHSKTGIKKVS
jgi:hypothetical protein